ncbi:hypothetical protein KCU71_g5461, partial [Aureobasidium melanogenum]
MEFLYEATMATILIGPDQKKFVIHQALLCGKSQYFTKALTGSFVESKTRVVRLEDVSPMLFRMFVSWLYDGKIVYTTSDGRSTIKQDFKSLESMPRDHSYDELQMKVDDTSTWPCEVLVELYILADRLDTKGLRIQAIDTMAELLLQRRKRLCFTAYSYIYANTTAKSPLRKLAVHVLAYHTRHNLAEQAFWMHPPHELAITALLMNSTMIKDSSPRKDKNLMPYRDMCLYHEHADEEEKKACRARRSKTVIK